MPRVKRGVTAKARHKKVLVQAKGYRGSYLLRRDKCSEVEFITILFWDSIDSIRAVAGPDYETSIIPEERRKYLSKHDAKAVHYEVASTHGLAD